MLKRAPGIEEVDRRSRSPPRIGGGAHAPTRRRWPPLRPRRLLRDRAASSGGRRSERPRREAAGTAESRRDLVATPPRDGRRADCGERRECGARVLVGARRLATTTTKWVTLAAMAGWRPLSVVDVAGLRKKPGRAWTPTRPSTGACGSWRTRSPAPRAPRQGAGTPSRARAVPAAGASASVRAHFGGLPPRRHYTRFAQSSERVRCRAAPRGPFCFLERRRGLADIIGVAPVLCWRRRVKPPY